MACDDRQLTQAQRQQGFLQQQRAGVMQAIRPFTGTPTLPNLVDYINREMFPVLRQARGKLNEVYRQVTDNAPSGNPLTYYFSADTTNSDPTPGRVRFDSATQDAATTIRISELNGQLRDATPWLDVMAGGVTAPLGVITLTDLSDPDRFIRFDLNTMTDQGAYWDLAVTPIESSHDNPFVDDNPLAIGFIPGVAGTGDGATIPPSSVTPMGAHTLLGNPTNATAAPTEIAMPTGRSVLGRKTATGDIVEIRADEFVPSSYPTAGNLVLRMSNNGSTMFWGRIGTATLTDVPSGYILINDSTTLAPLNARNVATLGGFGLYSLGHPHFNLNVQGSDSLIVNYNGVPQTNPSPTDINRLERAALTGDITAAQNSNTTAFRDFSALSVLGRTANTTGAPADIAATAASGAVLRESGSVIGWGTIATAGITDNAVTDGKIAQRQALSVMGRATNSAGNVADITSLAGSGSVLRESGSTIGWGTVTNAGLANMTAGTIKGRAITAGTGAPQDLTGLEVGQITRREFFVTGASLAIDAPGTYNDVALDQRCSHLFVNPTSDGDVIYTGFVHGSANTGAWFLLQKEGADGRIVLKHNTGSTSANQFWLPNDTDYVLTKSNDAVVCWYGGGKWRVTARMEGGGPFILGTQQNETAFTAGVLAVTLGESVTRLYILIAGDGDIQTITPASGTTTTGRVLYVMIVGSGIKTIKHAFSGGGAGRILCPNNRDHKFTNRQGFFLIGDGGNGWLLSPAPVEALSANALMVNSSASAGYPAELAVSTNTVVGRVSGNIVAAALVNAQMANMAAGTVKGRQVDAGTGAPVDLFGDEVGELLRRFNSSVDTLSSGTIATYTVTSVMTQIRFSLAGTATIAGMTATSDTFGKTLEIHCESGMAGSVVLAHESGSAGASGQRFRCPDARDLYLYANDSCTVTYFDNRWRVTGVARAEHHHRYPYFQSLTLAPGTYNNQAIDQRAHWVEVSPNADGDVIITGLAQPPANAGGFIHLVKIGSTARRLILKHEDAGSTAGNRIWTPNSADMVFTMGTTGVTLQYTGRWVCVGRPPMYRRNSTGTLFYRSMLNVIEGSGISTTMADDSTNDEIDLTIGVATGGVTSAMLRNSVGVSVIGRSANTTGVPADIAASANNRVLVRRSDALSFEQIVDGDIAAGTISLGKIVGINPNTLIGNNTGSATNPVEISVGTNTVVGRVAGNITAAQLVTAQITDANVTLAKMADLAQSRVIGRAEGAGTGVPTALTPTQVVSIIDGENATWTGAHSFTGSSHTINTAGTLSADAGFVDVASTGDVVISAGDTVTLAASNVVEINSPLSVNNTAVVTGGATFNATVTVASTGSFLAQSAAVFQSVVSATGAFSSATVGLNDLAIGNVFAVRLSGSAWILSGMAATITGQVTLIINTHTTDTGTILIESLSSSASNRFAGSGTSRAIKPGEMALSWYDSSSARWRLLCRDDIDL